MRLNISKRHTWQSACAATSLILAATVGGCVSAGMIGAKVVGHAVQEASVDDQSKKLLGQPIRVADDEFKTRVDSFEDVQTKREMIVYSVKGDVLSQYRWVVEAENGKIVSLAKMQYDADGGKDIIRRAVLEDKVIGKTPQQVGSDKHFKKLTVTLRDRSTKTLVRVYDIGGATDLLGARYGVLNFDEQDRCTGIRLVGVPASAGKAVMKR